MENIEYIYIFDYSDGNAYKLTLPKDTEDVLAFIDSKGFRENDICFMISSNNIDKFVNLDEE